VLREALEESGIRWRDQASLTTGGSWLELLDTELSRSDFVCVVLPAERRDNALFELGIAYAKRKPILVFIDSLLQLPSDIPSVTYVRSTPTNPETVRSVLRTFLEHAPVAPPRKAWKPPRKPKLWKERSPSTLRGTQFEQRTADLLQRAGFIVSGSAEPRGRGVDLAVWIDQLEHSLGNPLLVEVKAGDLSAKRLDEAAFQLRQYVAKTHGRCALLVYWDHSNREFPLASAGWPLVLQLSGAALSKLVAQGRLVQELVRLRNAAAHGGK